MGSEITSWILGSESFFFVKGMTHDLFLEAGVFLISVKVVAMAYKNSVEVKQLNAKLDRVLAVLEKK
ncbi:MAG: hypothetical protein WCS52_06080 [bacterium]